MLKLIDKEILTFYAEIVLLSRPLVTECMLLYLQSTGSFKDGSFLGGHLTPSSMAPLPEVSDSSPGFTVIMNFNRLLQRFS